MLYAFNSHFTVFSIAMPLFMWFLFYASLLGLYLFNLKMLQHQLILQQSLVWEVCMSTVHAS